MRPFFMSIVSDSNHWMFISSNGGLSAGRKNAEYALFPYYTDDKITELAHTTGSKTVLKVHREEKEWIWEPFSDRNKESFSITRNLYKNKYGNKIRFEEINHDLNLTFSYEWNSSNSYGFIRRSRLENTGGKETKIYVLDGLQNIMPYGVSSDLQGRASNLVDAYKRSELVKDTGLGIFALSAIIVDKAEPSEALKANAAWSFGLNNPTYLLSSAQIDKFRSNGKVSQETDVKGKKGAYLLQSDFSISSQEQKEWSIVANVNLDHDHVARLNDLLKSGTDLDALIDEEVENGTQNLIKLVASADGLQSTDDNLKDARHYSNVLFNIMRGGIFDDNLHHRKE